MELKIVKAAYGGYGLAFIDGMAVFTRNAFPGDRIAAVIKTRKKSHAFAEIAEILEPSPMRTSPECPNYELCGGCDYSGISYADEIEIKKQILLETIERSAGIGKENLPGLSVIQGPRSGYRSHAAVKFEDGSTGLFEKGTYKLVPFPPSGCRLLSEGINKELLAAPPPEGKGEFRIAEDAYGRVFRSDGCAQTLEEKEAGIIYRRDISGFFQANRFLREKMLSAVAGLAVAGLAVAGLAVAGLAVAGLAGAGPGMRFWDIGCGCGFFTLHLAANGNHGKGIDRDRRSIAHAKENARLNKIKSAEFLTADAATIDMKRGEVDVVIADPPRAGLSEKARAAIIGASARRIIYVSCNPSTFGRDLRDFVNFGYRLVELTFIDMFPGTMHIETICGLER